MRYAVVEETALRDSIARIGIPTECIESMVDIEKRFVAGDFDIVTDDVDHLSGRSPRSPRDALLDTSR